jgi:alpha-galactosidase
MKKLLATLLILVACIHVNAQESRQIRISTDRTDLILEVAPDGRLYQSYLGDRLLNEQDLKNLSGSSRGWEVYPGSGGEDYFEPAVAITNNDGNLSTILRYVSSEQKAVEGGTETIIRMKDDQYPVDVTLHYVAYPKQNVIKTWSEIKHQQKKPVVLWRYASTMLYFSNQKYYLTEFSSDWAKEVQMSTQQLQPGKKILDTKLGSRAAMHMQPFFELGLEQPAQEHQGQVVLGTIGWTGNYQFTFEVDNEGNLRIIPAINPYASDYQLKANETFTTPASFAFSTNAGIPPGSLLFIASQSPRPAWSSLRGIYNVLKRVKEKYPNVPMMLCSGGGARCDYEALKYFTEFWCSDNTDPVERLFIQWGFSQFFPAKAMCAHVTSWNSRTSVKFRTDVASMCKLGFDIGLKDMKADELTYCQEAVANYKRLKPVILDGDQYRLVSPYDGNHMAVMYTAPDASKAVLFTYDIHPRFGEKLLPVKLRGLDTQKMYRVKEINLMPGRKSNLSGNEKIFSGDYLMKIGLNAFTTSQTNSRVIELVAE